MAISRLVNSLKDVSSRRLRREFPDLRRHYWRASRLWSGSYFAGSAGGAPISVLRQYIEQQNRSSRERPESVRFHHRPEDRRTQRTF
jgi:putative transposase